MIFSLETASDYVKDDKACFYGFKCTVVGYEWASRPEEVRVTHEAGSVSGLKGATSDVSHFVIAKPIYMRGRFLWTEAPPLY